MNIFRNATDTSNFEAGALICREGDAGESMYAIIEGTVDIFVGERLLETLGPGEIFGEMSLIDSSPRSATAKAKTACRIATIDERQFGFMVQQTPYFALEVLRTLTKRLRKFLIHPT